MKYLRILFILLIASIGIAATTHEYFLLPENFFMHKGDKLNLHLLMGDQFVKQEELKYRPEKTAKFFLYEGSKKTDLGKIAKDTASPIISYPITANGQSLVEMTTGVEFNDASRDAYSEFLTGLGFEKMAENVKNSNQFRIKEKYSRYMKTLFSVGDHDGNAYGKVLNEDYEIILKDNPYKKKYGDDVTAQVKFKGKPVKGAAVTLYIKAISGTVYTENLATTDNGEVTFTMSREGIYLIRSVRAGVTKDKDADYECWWASYTFPFSSSDDVPNTYKEFGFGNKH